MSEKGRYDNLHGDEPEIEAARIEKQRKIREYKENHCEDYISKYSTRDECDITVTPKGV